MPRGEQQEVIEVEGEILRQSLKAVHFKTRNEDEDEVTVWVPKSQIDNLESLPKAGMCTIFMTVWIARKLELA